MIEPTPLSEALGDRLRKRRRRAGISLRQLAAKLDTSPSTVSLIENGKALPGAALIYRACLL